MLDRIDFNVQQTVNYVSKAVSETQAAVRLQKEARRVRIKLEKLFDMLKKKVLFFCCTCSNQEKFCFLFIIEIYLFNFAFQITRYLAYLKQHYYFIYKNQYAPIIFFLLKILS